MGTNIVRHAGGGEVLLRVLDHDGITGLEMLALDRGPGMASLAQSLTDGYSTAGSAGTGLGAIARQSDVFDAYTATGRGTALLSRVLAGGRAHRAPRSPFALGAVCIPVRGEECPGDDWSLLDLAGGGRLLVADGIGHGPEAAEAAAAAVAILRDNPGLSLRRLLEAMHDALRATRGAVVGVAEFQAADRVVHFAGVGNVSVSIWDGARSRSLVSMSGTVGYTLGTIREFSYPWPAGGLLIAHSDGLQTRWSLGDYPGLAARDPSLIAGVLYRDFSRQRDDVTVVALRERTA
jgi:hypothetical protein